MEHSPVQKLIVELHVDRGGENIRCHRFEIEFHEQPTAASAEPYLRTVLASVFDHAVGEIEGQKL